MIDTFSNFVFEVIEKIVCNNVIAVMYQKLLLAFFIFKLLTEKSLHIFVGYCVASLYVDTMTMIRSELLACPSPRAVFFFCTENI